MKSRFVRALVESVQQETGGTALARLRSGLPPYLLRVLSREVLAIPDRDASLDVDAAIELLLAIDRVLCGGSGVVMARASAALASRVLSQSEGLVVPGDTVATLQHLRAPFEHPFIDVEVRYSARRNSDGFVFELELLGHPRAAHWLMAAGLGYARAAAKFSGQSSAPLLRFDTSQVGDQARIIARKAESGTLNLSREPAARSEERARSTPRRRSSPTNAAARVDEILGRSAALGVPARSGEVDLHLAKTRAAPSTDSAEPAPATSGVRPSTRESRPPNARKNVS